LKNYFFRRSLPALATLFGVITLVFFLFHALPADPARMMMGQQQDSSALASIQKELGLDKALWKQYLLYLNDLSVLSVYPHPSLAAPVGALQNTNWIALISTEKKIIVLKTPYLGKSFQTGRTVSAIISSTLPSTAVLAVVAMCIATLLGILAGTLAAFYHNRWPDKLLILLASSGLAGPSFFMAIVVAWLFAFVWGDFTGLNLCGSLYTLDDSGEFYRLEWQNIILPAFTLGIRPLAVITQLMRNSLLEVYAQDYIRTAKAKGLKPMQILWRHAYRNALTPVITAISGWFAGLLAGAVFVEYVFGWKGLGREMVNALENADLPVVMGAVLVISFLFVCLNLLVDLIYKWLDPRIRLS
jgi:peptide/nickel transport system permease protein